MTATLDRTDIATAVSAYLAAVDGLLAADLSRASGRELAEQFTRLEAGRRRSDAFDARLVAALDTARVAGEYGRTSTLDLLCQSVAVSPREAKTRVERAQDLGPRAGLTGEPLEPLCPLTADTHAQGTIATGQADAIRTGLARIDTLICPAPEAFEVCERLLVKAAVHGDSPRALTVLAQQLIDRLDPDGREPRDDAVDASRDLSLRTHADGAFELRGRPTPELAAQLQAMFDGLAAPLPASSCCPDAHGSATLQPDPRTAGQRRHDALAEVLHRVLGSGTLPVTGGITTTVHLRIDWRDYLAAIGRASDTPGHGAIPDAGRASGIAVTAHGLAAPLARLLPCCTPAVYSTIVTNDTGAVLAYGTDRRCATPVQRRLLAARDGGCCFPGCGRPAAWTEAHHIIRAEDGGPTDLVNLCLLCRWHHRYFEAAGWQVYTAADGMPEWLPPPWVDAERTPVRNRAHHPPDLDFEIEPRAGADG